MNKKVNKVLSLVVALSISAGLLGSSGTLAEETVVNLSRDEVGQRAVANSAMIKGLETSRKDLSVSYGKIGDSMKGLKAMYNLLPRYQQLFNSYTVAAAIPGYLEYLDIMVLFITGVDDVTINTAKLVALNTTYPTLAMAIANISNMQVPAYLEYKALQPQFVMMGIANPNLSKAEEYEMFISPIYVTPMSMQTGVMTLGIAIESATAGLKSGAVSLYDAILLMEGYLELQEKSYIKAQSDRTIAEEKYKAGVLSENDYIIASNKESIAKLNRDQMVREVENLTMNLSVMLGQDVTTELVLTSKPGQVKALQPIETYLVKALKERSELRTLAYNRTAKVAELDLLDDYYSTSTTTYKIGQSELKDMDLEKQELEQQIEQEIRKAYMNVEEKKEKYRLAQLTLEDQKRQYKDLELNVSLGFVTSSTRLGLDIMIAQGTNDYYTAYRDYLTAVAALEGASSIGPAYNGSGGGMTF